MIDRDPLRAKGFLARAAPLLCAFLLQPALPARASAREHDPALARSILSNRDMACVRQRSLALLAKGFNAGDGYPQVWIRDLNTFVEAQLEVYDHATIRRSLIDFLRLQQGNGEIVDGYVAKGHVTWKDENQYVSPDGPDLFGFKNTVETDQESSLIQAIAKYVRATGDRSILTERVGDVPVLRRLEKTIAFLRRERWSPRHRLLKGGTTQDWGDVQVEGGAGVDLDERSHWAVDVYDNAMFVIALRDMAELDPAGAARWTAQADRTAADIRRHLWDAKRDRFVPHRYVAGSPFPPGFAEDDIYYHGGTAVAIEAGLLSPAEIARAYARMKANVRASGAPSIGLTLYPPYPATIVPGSTTNREYHYQNGGDWTWFGARMVRQLAEKGRPADAYEAIGPMIARTLRDDGFHEWYTRDGRPEGSAAFKGSAGALVGAIDALHGWSRTKLPGDRAASCTQDARVGGR